MDRLLGAWSLQSSITYRDEVPSHSYSEKPRGQIQYTEDGRMSGFLMHPDWRARGTNATKEDELFLAYAGAWTIVGDEVRHAVEFCTIPNWIGRELVRRFRFFDDCVELSTAPETSKSGATYVTKLIWRKMRR